MIQLRVGSALCKADKAMIGNHSAAEQRRGSRGAHLLTASQGLCWFLRLPLPLGPSVRLRLPLGPRISQQTLFLLRVELVPLCIYRASKSLYQVTASTAQVCALKWHADEES